MRPRGRTVALMVGAMKNPLAIWLAKGSRGIKGAAAIVCRCCRLQGNGRRLANPQGLDG